MPTPNSINEDHGDARRNGYAMRRDHLFRRQDVARESRVYNLATYLLAYIVIVAYANATKSED